MTAFAAVLTRSRVEPDQATVAHVQAALSAIYGTPPRCVQSKGCAVIAAPPQTHPADTIVEFPAGVTSAGQVLLEDPSSLAQELDAPVCASNLTLIATAYSRWGVGFTKRISGEFSFVIWDARAGVLVSARDGLGIRLVYASATSSSFILTNVLAAAVGAPGFSERLDEIALIQLLAEGAPADGRTAFRDVAVIPAGHTLRLEVLANTVSLTRHWWFPQQRQHRRRNDSEILEGYREALTRAAGDRLRTPSAAILFSGGIDSTCIAAAARRAAPGTQLRAFTAVYRRLPAHGELHYAQLAADSLEIPLTTVDGDSFEALDHLCGAAATPAPIDEPALSDWRLLVGAAARHSPVGLYGEDGDTLFGPPGWRALRREASLGDVLLRIMRFLRNHRRLPYLGLRVRDRLRFTASRSSSLPPFLSQQALRLLESSGPATVFGRTPQPLDPHPTRPRAQSVLCRGVARYLAPLVAPEVTRQPIELRCPLLDSRVIQFVVDVPAVPWCQHKRLPRLAYGGVLPDAVLGRPKQSVRGLHELLVLSWQRKRRTLDAVGHPVLAWIDTDRWRRAVLGNDPFAVALAWRVLQLNRWLSARHKTHGVQLG